MKLLIDMNLWPGWVEFFAKSRIAAVHWSTMGRPDAPDSEIAEFAQINDYVILTHDLDFGAILAVTGGKKPSVVILRADDVSPDAIGEKVLAALQAVTSELERGALLVVDPVRARLRLLPLLAE